LNTLAINIRIYRKQKGLSQRALGKLIGVDHSHISKWETGNINPGADNLIKLAQVFGVSTKTLMGKSSPESVFLEQVQEDVQSYFEPQMADFKPQDMRFLRDYLKIHVQFMNKYLGRSRGDQHLP
jgi:transcriptional regulator with XRE-family HTH domain